MSIDKFYYTGIAGNNFINDPTLANVTLLKVARSGKIYSSTSSYPPEDLKYKFVPGDAEIFFKDVFDTNPEIILVIYKH